ncbi:hypothetical protein [Moorena producens]|uniref:hypothetical protein n=1 Tax=Moorena producens TaxID=1155739 RepID=UPI0011EA61C3|nr:hypothetical protein [Moorena producens]
MKSVRCSFRAATRLAVGHATRTQNSIRSPHLPISPSPHLPTPPTPPTPPSVSRLPIPDSRFPTPYLQIDYRFRTQLGITYYG